MIQFDKAAFRKRLMEEGYSDFESSSMVEKIQRLDEQLNDVLNVWINEGTVSDFAVNGVTITEVMEKTRSNFLSALFAMSVFIEKPEMAKTFKEIPFFPQR